MTVSESKSERERESESECEWRTHQTKPLISAKLGQLQCEISVATVATLKAAK